MFIFGIVLLLALGVWLVYKRKDKFRQKFTCAEGDFRIVGKKGYFKIQKDNRFEFTVVDGQIVSFRDHAASNAIITYGGDMNGTV